MNRTHCGECVSDTLNALLCRFFRRDNASKNEEIPEETIHREGDLLLLFPQRSSKKGERRSEGESSENRGRKPRFFPPPFSFSSSKNGFQARVTRKAKVSWVDLWRRRLLEPKCYDLNPPLISLSVPSSSLSSLSCLLFSLSSSSSLGFCFFSLLTLACFFACFFLCCA